MGFKIASSGGFQNSQCWCSSNFGTRLGVSEKAPVFCANLRFPNARCSIGWSRMSGRRTSRTSRLSLGGQVLAVFSFISSRTSQFKKCLGKCLEVPDIFFPFVIPPSAPQGVGNGFRRFLAISFKDLRKAATLRHRKFQQENKDQQNSTKNL